VLNKAKHRFALSPDGTQVAFSEKQDENNVLAIVSLAGGQIVKSFKYSNQQATLAELKWLPDGRGLAYILADNKSETNTLWLQSIDKETPRQIVSLGDEQVANSGFA